MKIDITDPKQIADIAEKLPPDVSKEFVKTYFQIQELDKTTKIKNDFMSFVKHVWPDFIEGSHHTRVANIFNRIARGELKRLIVNMPPRHTKSEFASFLYCVCCCWVFW